MNRTEAVERDEFRTPCSPRDIRVVQITSDTTRDSEAFYLDLNSWTADGKRLAFHRGPSDDGARPAGFWLCDVENAFEIAPIHEYRNYRPGFESAGDSEYGCVLEPAGSCAYLLERRSDRMLVSRLPLDRPDRREAVCEAPAPLLARGSLSISADGERVCCGVFLGDGRREGAPWGAYVFDVRRGTWRSIEFGNGYRNMHCQYSHDPDSRFSHDILLNASLPRFADGSWLTPPDGSWRFKDLPTLPDDLGGAYTVVRDDGTDWRMVPLGRDSNMRNGGHNTWRGRTYSVVGSAYHTPPERWRAPLLEAAPLPIGTEADAWLGQRHPNARCVDLTRRLARADSCHFGFDASGVHFVSDTDGYAKAEYSFLYVGTHVQRPGDDPRVETRYLLLPRTSWKTQPAHPHPYLSPDGRYVVFQSDFTGRPQVYVAYEFDYPPDPHGNERSSDPDGEAASLGKTYKDGHAR